MESHASPRPLTKEHKKNHRSSSTARSKRQQQWWQDYVVRNSVPTLIESLDHAVSSSSFLRDTPISSHVALFARSEVIVGNVIGSGGFSDVYEINRFELSPDISARCDPTQQRLREIYAANPSDYCIKVLKQRLTTSKPEFTRAALDLVLEAAYLSRLDHAHILKLRGLCCDGIRGFDRYGYDGFFLITDKLTHNLEQQIHDPPAFDGCRTLDLRMDQKIEYALQLAQALLYLHERRIVFRDLKPHNIGFDRNANLILFDFGLCREIPPGMCGNTDLYEMSGVGTRRYLAPEVLNSGCYNLKADVYGWALVTWEFLSGQRPFAAYSIEQHRIQVCLGGERPRMRQFDWPQYLQDILQQSWRENVRDRLDMATVVDKLTRELHPPQRPIATDRVTLPDSPVCVYDFIDEQTLHPMPDDSCLRIPDLPPPPKQQRRQVSLDPRLLPSHADTYETDTSSLEFDRRAIVLDSSLLGFTINLGEDCGVEVCANPDAFWICPSFSHNERETASPSTKANAPRRMIRPSCSV
jgi:serine/threonine protein kinase